MTTVEEIERVCREMCELLGMDWEDFLATLRVLRRSSDWSKIGFRAGGIELELSNDSWKGLNLRVTRQEQGVRTIREHDLSYLRI